MIDTDSDSAIEAPTHNIPAPPTKESVLVNSHVLVKYPTQRKTNIHYVGAVVGIENDWYKINFIRKAKGTAASFIYPEEEDVDDKVKLENIDMDIGNPSVSVALAGLSVE